MWGSSRGSVGGVRWGDQREVHNRARTGLHGFLHRVGRCHLYEVYAEGPARPTGGAAAIAMLIGPNAPIAFETKLGGTHMSHIYDFYKLNLANEYPVVDGKLSQTCYLLAVDSCYKRFCSKYEKLEGKQFSILDADYVAFHSPYNKISFLCRKALPGSYSTTFCGMSVRSTRMLKRSLHHLQACLVMKVIRTVVLKRSNGPPWF